MPLDPATGDTVGAAIATALAALDKSSDQSAAAWKIAVKQIFAAIVAHGSVIIPPAAIVTTGGPATQTGPAAPVPLSIT
jgi:hypothetical protein